MTRYFFHLRSGGDEVLDTEGADLLASAIREATLSQARDCIAGDVMAGRLDLHYRIDVENEAGVTIHSLSFADALDVVPGH